MISYLLVTGIIAIVASTFVLLASVHDYKTLPNTDRANVVRVASILFVTSPLAGVLWPVLIVGLIICTIAVNLKPIPRYIMTTVGTIVKAWSA